MTYNGARGGSKVGKVLRIWQGAANHNGKCALSIAATMNSHLSGVSGVEQGRSLTLQFVILYVFMYMCLYMCKAFCSVNFMHTCFPACTRVCMCMCVIVYVLYLIAQSKGSQFVIKLIKMHKCTNAQ